MKERVLIIGPVPPPQGGVASVIQFVLRSELERDFDLLHLDITRKGGLGGAGCFSISNLVQFFQQTARLLTMIIRYRPAVVHLPVTSGWSFWKEGIFYLVSKAMGRKTLLHLHGGGFMDFYWHSSRFTQFMVRQVFNTSEGVIVLSEKWQRFLQQCVTRRPTICVIPNSVSTEFIQDLENHRPQSGNRKVTRILFLGHLTERKGVFEILHAIPEVVARHPDAVFAIAGPEASQGIRQKMEDTCRALGCREHVELLGEVHGSAKAEAFMTASLFLLPSHVENLSVAILEAMCAGLPIITTRVGANTDILQEGRNCLFVPLRDSASIARAVCFLLESEQVRARMGVQNREVFERRFWPVKIIQQLGQLYAEICAGDRATPGTQTQSETIADVQSVDSGALASKSTDPHVSEEETSGWARGGNR